MSETAPQEGAFEKASFIRLKVRSKKPVGDFETSKCTFAEAGEWARAGHGNVGLILDASTSITDIDIDEPRLLPIVDGWLPHTDWVFGRDTSPRSHRLYLVNEPRKPKAFSHGEKKNGWKDKKFVDIRCKMQGQAGYTVIPPGTHEGSGERIVWMTPDNMPRVGRPSRNDPPTVDYKELVRVCGILAAIAIAASCWADGGRHDIMLAIEGYLAKKGWSIDDRRRFIADVNEISDNPWDVRERDGQVESTLRNTQRKLEANEHDNIAGITQLKTHMGEKQAKAFDNALKAHEEKDDDDGGGGHGTFSWDGFARAFGQDNRLIFWEDEAYQFIDGLGWTWVRPGIVERMALRWLADRMIGKHSELKASPGDVKDLIKTMKIQLMLYSHPPIIVAEDKTQPDSEWFMGVGNGVLDLRTSTLTPYTPEVFIPRQTEVAYDPDAKCPQWDSFLASLVVNEPDHEEGARRIRSIEEMLAYPLTKWRGAQKIFALIGPPRSGKGTMLRVLERFLGHMVTSVEFSDLGKPFGLETIIGKTALYIHEPGADFRHTDTEVITSRLKAISGGDDIAVARKNKTNLLTQPRLAIIMAMNEFPRLNDRSGALASRFHPVALTESFLGKEDVRLDQRLATESTGILARLVTVCAELFEQQSKEGRIQWTMTQVATERQEETAARTGSMMHFAQLTIEPAADGELGPNEAFNAYLGYCEQMGTQPAMKYRGEDGVRVFMADLVRLPMFRNTDKERRSTGRTKVVYRLGVRLTKRGRELAAEHAEVVSDADDRRKSRADDDQLPF